MVTEHVTKMIAERTAENHSVDKYRLAAECVIKMVVERIADNHGWTINETLEKLTTLEIFDRLQEPDTSLWTTNPVDLADMVETELRGEEIAPERYFY